MNITKKLKWRLIKDGDIFERAYCPFIKDSLKVLSFEV